MIDEIKLIDELKQSGMIADNAYGNDMVDMIESQPKIGGWIPCSERLPTKEEYLKNYGRFMLDDGNRRYQGLFDIHDRKFKFSKHITGIHYELYEDRCVIAWQPLPEPYRG